MRLHQVVEVGGRVFRIIRRVRLRHHRGELHAAIYFFDRMICLCVHVYHVRCLIFSFNYFQLTPYFDYIACTIMNLTPSMTS
jgi:hypothetical protein